jgi:hypothetical protein
MSAVATVALMSASTVGLGAVVLAALGVKRHFHRLELAAWSFAVGFGAFGWLAFFPALAGKLGTLPLLVLAAAFLPGLTLFRRPLRCATPMSLSSVEWALAACLAAAVGMNIVAALAPPSDADSLAYHFATPKLFLDAGRLYFIPRAQDGAAPLLVQMTYMVALGLGGERAMTLWAMVSGWGATALLYCVVRAYVPRPWALATGLVFLTTPAVIYGASSGQVEVRNVMFVLAAAAACAHSLKSDDLRHAVLAGLAAGFYVASKYPGLIFAFACGLVLLIGRRWFVRGAVYSAAVVLAGGQWYLWNYWNSGDPVFPLLYGVVDYLPGFPWTPEQQQYYLQARGEGEFALAPGLWSALIYPIVATFQPLPEFESSKTGFGIYAFLILPLSIIGAWRWRTAIRTSPLLAFAAVGVVTYAVWFALAPSQRVRFLLPIYPLFILVLTVAAVRATQSNRAFVAPAVLAFVLALAVQSGVQALYTVNFARYLFTGETRNAYLARNIRGYESLHWLDQRRRPGEKLLTPYRELIYLAKPPVFYSHPLVEARIDTRPTISDADRLYRQLRDQDVTYILNNPPRRNPPQKSGLLFLLQKLLDRNCLREIDRRKSLEVTSRTLPGRRRAAPDVVILRMTPDTCQAQHAGSTNHAPG